MKIGVWIALFVVLLGLAYLTDISGHHPGDTFLSIPVFFWWALNLSAFLYLIARFVGTPVLGMFDARGEKIREELEQARQKLAEAETLKSQVLARLETMETEVAAIRERAESQGRTEAEEITAQAGAEEERFLKRVEDEITRRHEETRKQLAREAADLTAAIAAELLQKQMTPEDRRQVFDRSLDALRQVEGR
jgi:F-type H+-transporting ATPase subunit b